MKIKDTTLWEFKIESICTKKKMFVCWGGEGPKRWPTSNFLPLHCLWKPKQEYVVDRYPEKEKKRIFANNGFSAQQRNIYKAKNVMFEKRSGTFIGFGIFFFFSSFSFLVFVLSGSTQTFRFGIQFLFSYLCTRGRKFTRVHLKTVHS